MKGFGVRAWARMPHRSCRLMVVGAIGSVGDIMVDEEKSLDFLDRVERREGGVELFVVS